MPHQRSLPIAPQRLSVVLGKATPGCQQIGQVVQAPVQPGLRGETVMAGSAGQVHITAPAMLQAPSEHVVGHSAVSVAGNCKPGTRQRRVLLDTTPIQQDLPEQQLCFDNPLPRCGKNTLGGLARTCFEHCAQLIGIQNLFTTQIETHRQTSTQRRSRL
ncbi:hypothetical protein D3C80_1464480 [compost metagenome]